jgi:hypothetical protein
MEAVKAFAKMMPVFKHDRCLNCHGKFNVLSVDEHSGAVNAKESKLDPTTLLTVSQRMPFTNHAQTVTTSFKARVYDRS